MKFLRLALAAMALVVSISVIGCAGETTTPEDGTTPPATEEPAK